MNNINSNYHLMKLDINNLHYIKKKKINVSYIFIYLTLCILFIYSCGSAKMEVYSDRNYKPIPAIETSYYKSPQLRKNQDSTLTLGISISGGGSRAQYFGFGVLVGLDEIEYESINKNSFLEEIDYFSTVSGGGYGAGYYLTLKKIGALDRYNSLYDFWNSDLRKDSLQQNLFKSASKLSVLKMRRYERNGIRTPYTKMIDKQLLQLGKHYPYPNQHKKIDTLKLADFFIPINDDLKNVELPMLVTNATIYNNGERLPFMPHIIDSLNISGSLIPVQNFKNIDNGYGLPLTYAITGSAAFPGALPMLKLKVSDDDNSVIRVLDGGAVDNLGFTTLFELLNSDKTNLVNKKALIVDCSGYGSDIQRLPNERLSIMELVEKSLLYTVDVKKLYADKDIDLLVSKYNMDRKNVLQIGYSTIKEKYQKLKETASQPDLKELQKLKNEYQTGDVKWDDAYINFYNNLHENNFSFSKYYLSEIPTYEFKNFDLIQVFQIFELAAQVITKVKIQNNEKEILILAGRYSVYIESKNIKKLISK